MGSLYLFTSDTHNGGDTALMPEATYSPKQNEHILMNKEQSELQKIIYEQWEDVAREAKKRRKRFEQTIWFMNGDAVDGDHHDTNQLVTKNLVYQTFMHIQCVKNFRKIYGWKDTDRMIYTDGTEVHVGHDAVNVNQVIISHFLFRTRPELNYNQEMHQQI